ncbi:copper resistance protein CopC [Sphingobium sp. Ant17]|nr:copper resistance protein CopC [Sphingobium sp. Ant17]
MRALLAIPMIAGLALATPAVAHPRLVASTPSATSIVRAPTRITLTFSEKLMAQLSGIDLTMTGMPGMANHAPMKVTGLQISVSNGGKTLMAALPHPLSSGTYEVRWHAVSADTHRIEGQVAFTVT